MMWLPANVDAFRKMALLRVVPRSTRTFVFYEMAPGLMWAVIFHTQKNDLYLSQLADGPDERNHLERMSEAVSTCISETCVSSCHRHHRRCRLRLRHHRRRRLRSSLAAFVLNPMISTARWSSSHSAADASRGFTTGACRHGTRKPGNQSLHSLGLTLHGGGRTRSLHVPVVGPLLKWGARPPPPAPRAPKGL